MIKFFLAVCLLLMTSFAQSQTTYVPGSQNFQSITTTLKNSNSWPFIVDQNIELDFNPLTEVISFDLKKVRFQRAVNSLLLPSNKLQSVQIVIV